MEEKIYDLLAKFYTEVKQDINGIKQDVGSLKQDVGSLKQDVGSLKQDVGNLKQDVGSLKQGLEEVKQDVRKLDLKIDTEVSDKLKIMADEQSLMRKDILDIKQHVHAHDTKLDDLTDAVNDLYHIHKEHEEEIIKLKKAK